MKHLLLDIEGMQSIGKMKNTLLAEVLNVLWNLQGLNEKPQPSALNAFPQHIFQCKRPVKFYCSGCYSFLFN